MPDFVLEWGMGGGYSGQHEFAYATAENQTDAAQQAWIFACEFYDGTNEASAEVECECCNGTGYFTDTDSEETCDVCNGIGLRLKTTEEYQEDCESWIDFSAIPLDPEIHDAQWLSDRNGEDYR